ncbi:Uncharacterised protein [Enterobacter cloacae]|nr:Uncharacterised protein [Enterobacter cloacae]
MAGREIILQRQTRPACVADDHILIFKPAYLLQFRMADLLRRAETERQIHFTRQQLRQRRAVWQITQFKTQTRRGILQRVHQGGENAKRGKICNRNVQALATFGRFKLRLRGKLMIKKRQSRCNGRRELCGIHAG